MPIELGEDTGAAADMTDEQLTPSLPTPAWASWMRMPTICMAAI